MKLFKAGTVLQILYILGCLIVVVCMPLYGAFYPTAFGMLCFRIGALFNFISTINPTGLIGTAMHSIARSAYNLKVSKKHLIWSNIAPVLLILAWVLAVRFFVHYSGGV